ncbi:MAG: hypothetical protein ACRDWI_13535 [Jiangellaceae bacterium]
MNRHTTATVVLAVAGIIAAFIALAIVLVLVDANEGNVIVNAIVEVGRFFSTPFHDMFPQSDAERNVLVNWGLAALAYLLVGGIVARFVR